MKKKTITWISVVVGILILAFAGLLVQSYVENQRDKDEPSMDQHDFWKKIHEDTDGTAYYLDKAFIERNNYPMIAVRVTIYPAKGHAEYKKASGLIEANRDKWDSDGDPESYLYTSNSMKVDCLRRLYRIDTVTLYDKFNNGIISALPADSGWQHIQAESAYEKVLKDVCAKKGR